MLRNARELRWFETIAKLKIRPAASAGAGFRLLSDVLRSRVVMWQMCADYDGNGILGSGIVIGVRWRSGPLRGRGAAPLLRGGALHNESFLIPIHSADFLLIQNSRTGSVGVSDLLGSPFLPWPIACLAPWFVLLILVIPWGVSASSG